MSSTAYQIPGLRISGVAATELKAGTFAMVDANENICVASAGGRTIGVVMENVNTGETATVAGGIMYVTASAAIAAGAAVSVAAEGLAVTAASDATVVGIALTAAAQGKLATIKLN